ncbi:MAG: ASCH domain-containing protein [Bacilli bacterium]|nr:ASCH domain-containing protein [Bacilli bacterium]
MKKHKITKKKYDSRVYKNWVNSLETWSFDSKYLFDLVRRGKKQATSYLYEENDLFNEYSVLKEGNRKLLLKTTKIEIKKFKDVSEKFALKEGEGDSTLDYWRKAHREFFTKELNGGFNEDIKIVCEEFKVVSKI